MSNGYQTETLRTTLQGDEFEPYKKEIMRKVLGIQMLASIQDNLCLDIQNILNAHGKYKYTLKMNLKQLRRDVLVLVGNDTIFGRMSEDQLDKHMEAYEPLEKMVYDFINKDEEVPTN